MITIRFTQALLIIIAVTFIVYGNTLVNDWTYDDLYVVNQPEAQSLPALLHSHSFDRSLRMLSHIPEHMLFGLKPAGYHVQQMLWHGANGVLLLLLLQCLGIDIAVALAGVLLFIVHPLQSESVASIGHRKELLALFFSLASLLAYIKAVAHDQAQRWGFAALSLTLYLIALLANLTIVTLPLIAVLYDSLLVPKERRILLKSPLVFCVLGTASGAAFLFKFSGMLTIQERLIIYSQNSFFENYAYYPLFWAALKAFGIYVSKILIPVNLAPEYAFRFSNQLFQTASIPGLLLLIGAISSMIILRKKAPRIAFAIGWFLILYIPISNFIPLGYIVADRYMYVCLPAVALIASSCLTARHRPGILISYGILILLLSSLTIRQNTFWRNSLTLWEHATQVSPTSTGAHLSAATTYFKWGNFSKARFHAEKVVGLNASMPFAHYILGMIFMKDGDIPAAIQQLEIFSYAGAVNSPTEAAYVAGILPKLKQKMSAGNQ